MRYLSHVITSVGHVKYSLLFSSIMLAGVNYAVADNAFEGICEKVDENLVECTLPESEYSADLESNILPIASAIDERIDYNTPFALQVWGGEGGGHSNNAGGVGGFGQLSATMNTFYNEFNTLNFYYYLGNNGEYKNTSSGTGGLSSIVTLSQDTDGILNLENILIISGGGGGGGSGNPTDNGGAGGVGVSDIDSVISAAGSDGSGSHGGSGGNSSGDGNGGMSDAGGGNAMGGDGIGGLGGEISFQDISLSNEEWLNEQPNIDTSSGKGGHGNELCNGGGGGGGYGGGGAGKGGGSHDGFFNEDICSKADDYYGGGGGGTYVQASLYSDSLFPSSYTSHDVPQGEVKLIFDASKSTGPDCTVVTTGSQSESLVRCDLINNELVNSVNIALLLESANEALGLSYSDFVLDGDTPAWISAYSGSGQGEEIDTNLDYTNSSMAGARGYAQTQLTLNDISGDTLYYYIGAQGDGATSDTSSIRGSSSDYINAARGGSATLVTTSELTSSNPLSENNAIIVAGGGGGAGSYSSLLTWDDNAYGGSGGGGGIAIATYNEAASAVGEDGYSSTEGYQGKGGNSDGLGTGGQGGLGLAEAAGGSLWGGNGGTLMDYYKGAYGDCSYVEAPGWTNGTPYFTDDSGQGGSGLMGTDVPSMYQCDAIYVLDMDLGSAFGAGGGGGYGAGGGSVSYYIDTDTTSSSTDYDYFYSGGAGGAGSYAAPATIADVAYQPTLEDIVPTTGDGEVSITFHVTLDE